MDDKSLDILSRESFSSVTGIVGWGIGFEVDEPMACYDCGGSEWGLWWSS